MTSKCEVMLFLGGGGIRTIYNPFLLAQIKINQIKLSTGAFSVEIRLAAASA